MIKKKENKKESKLKLFFKIFFRNKVVEFGGLLGVVLLVILFKYLNIINYYYTIQYYIVLVVLFFIGINVIIALNEVNNYPLDAENWINIIFISILILFAFIIFPLACNSPNVYTVSEISDVCKSQAPNEFINYKKYNIHSFNKYSVECIFSEGNYTMEGKEFKQYLKENE